VPQFQRPTVECLLEKKSVFAVGNVQNIYIKFVDNMQIFLILMKVVYVGNTVL
jgi:hypothetical protein